MLASLGVSNEADVSISPGNDFRCPVGADFILSCKFTFLTPKHFALMWRKVENK
ncbi:hypothetical protein XENOCAPTIV_026039, partial [Xenoophorus captivus]